MWFKYANCHWANWKVNSLCTLPPFWDPQFGRRSHLNDGPKGGMVWDFRLGVLTGWDFLTAGQECGMDQVHVVCYDNFQHLQYSNLLTVGEDVKWAKRPCFLYRVSNLQHASKPADGLRSLAWWRRASYCCWCRSCLQRKSRYSSASISQAANTVMRLPEQVVKTVITLSSVAPLAKWTSVNQRATPTLWSWWTVVPTGKWFLLTQRCN